MHLLHLLNCFRRPKSPGDNSHIDHSKKPNVEDSIELVKLCQSHTVNDLTIHHDHMVKTMANNNKLLINTLEYDLSNASDYRDITNNHLFRHVQKATASKPKTQEAAVVTNTGASNTEDTGGEERAEVSSQGSATATTMTESDASTHLPEAHLESDWSESDQSDNSGLSQRAHTGNTTEDSSDIES